MSKEFDVIIGGAGPVGLFLACELGLAGVSVLVLEREPEISTPWTEDPLGLRGMNTLTIESLYRRGLMDAVFDIENGREDVLEKTFSFRFAGHFAGIMLDLNKFDLTLWKYRLPGPALVPARSNVARIATVLSERAESFGVKILRGKAVTGFSQDSESVTVHAGALKFRGKYLVGCDGGRSVIRKEAGIEFTGTQAQFTGYTALCDLEGDEDLKPGFQATPGGGMYIVRPFEQVIVMDFDGGKYDRSQSVTREHFQEVLRRVSGVNVTVKNIRIANTFTDRSLQATKYRNGRVFLAGDSAHIHSPLGGQGMNAGIGDAMNLGWKLAATIKGTAPDDLLDTYFDERYPVGQWVCEWTRAQVSILKPDPFSAAAYQLMKNLIDTVDGTNYMIDKVWGLSLRYDMANDHPLVGSSAPDFEFVDETSLGSKMLHGKGVFVDFKGDGKFAALCTEWSDQVDYIDTRAHRTLGLDALLIRPDGIVAWLAESGSEVDYVATRIAMERWFGQSIQPYRACATASSSQLVV